MRYEYVDPFVNTTVRVMNSTIPGVSRRKEVAVVRGDQVCCGDVSVAIQVDGDSEGDVIISMDTRTALGICSVLLGSKVDSLTPLALDALGEIGNTIAGNAISELNDLGFDFTIDTPKVTAGRGNAARGNRETLQIPLDSDCGEIWINILLLTD